LTQVHGTFCFIAERKSVTHNIRGFIERLLRAAQRVLGHAALRTVVEKHCARGQLRHPQVRKTAIDPMSLKKVPIALEKFEKNANV